MPRYFAYGSNMSHDQIRTRCPSRTFVCVAELRGYRLAFTRYSPKRQCGVADIVASPGASVWGALFDMSEEDLAALDRHEGAHLSPPAYVRVHVQVSTPDGGSVEAITYEVFDKSPVEHVPSADYLGLMVDGAWEWGLPDAYRAALRGIRSAP
ncbi:gamma-glutamylcyclotransferase family protein [Variovorax ureilyticus]|uniref:Gamma-glutamylcyclotransferase family protein n=1 Tax=Variovorax ureilyticus TaxID=1836198 RepID=A0ABU8VAD3_9BURK